MIKILFNIGARLWHCTKLQRASCDIFISKCNRKKPTSDLPGNTAEITGADRTMSENISVFKLRGLLETFLEDKNNPQRLGNGSGGLTVL